MRGPPLARKQVSVWFVGKGRVEGRGGERFPAAQVADLHMQRLAVIRVGQVILRFAVRHADMPRPARQVSVVKVLHDVLRALGGDRLLVGLPRHPLAVDLEQRRLPGGQPQRQQVAALLQVALNGRRGGHRQRARAGQHQQVITLGRQQRLVGQDSRADELGGVAGGLDLSG